MVASGSVVTGEVSPSVFLWRAVELFKFLDERLERIEKAEPLSIQIVNEVPVKPGTVAAGADDVISRIA